eukprot:COSAG02_NODE_50292_length_321_cov_0.932432_1_plen_20_part_01
MQCLAIIGRLATGGAAPLAC